MYENLYGTLYAGHMYANSSPIRVPLHHARAEWPFAKRQNLVVRILH